jgi:hypothetical protein
MRNVVWGAALLGGLLAGCASGQKARTVAAPAAAPPPAAAPAPARKTKLAVLPVEKILLPGVAEALNQRLSRATVEGVSETTTATISMDVAMMQLDCSQPTNDCYGQIGKKLEADRLLWAEIERAKKGKSRKKAPAPTIIRITLFDVEKAEVVGRAEQSFPLGAVTDGEIDELLTRATTGRSGETVGATSP